VYTLEACVVIDVAARRSRRSEPGRPNFSAAFARLAPLPVHALPRV
jgi:hypothetical protein